MANLWLALVTRGHRALDPLDLHRPEVVRQALVFAASMTVVDAVIRLPALASAGERIRLAAGQFVSPRAASATDCSVKASIINRICSPADFQIANSTH